MGKLLKFEFRKLSKSKSFYICLFLSLGMLLISAFSAKSLLGNSESGGFVYPLADFVRDTLSNGNVVLLTGIFVAIFLCEDDSCGTIKNIYAKGYSREKVFFAKYIASLAGVMVIVLLDFLVSYLYSLAYFDTTADKGNLVVDIIGQIAVILAYHAIYVAISVWLKKTGGAVAFNIVGPSLVSLILTMIDIALKDRIKNFLFGNYWVQSLLYNFLTANPSTSAIVTGFVGSAIYIALAIALGLFVSKKKEL